tara:strand:- start:1653 stop:1838 length:186 start_codon:yes stop_codon:yes gene_type:complete
MTTDTIKSSVSETFKNLPKYFQEFKEKYCPDGQQCTDFATIGGLVFCFFFMYIAMKPIFVF